MRAAPAAADAIKCVSTEKKTHNILLEKKPQSLVLLLRPLCASDCNSPLFIVVHSILYDVPLSFHFMMTAASVDEMKLRMEE
jgi:hypothetical protein